MLKKFFLLFTLLISLSFASKRGIAAWEYTCDQLNILTNISWLYDWSYSWSWSYQNMFHNPNPKTCALPKEYISMIWGKFNVTDNLPVPKDAQYILGFNEPDIPPVNATPMEAAQLWPFVEKIALSIGAKLVSPVPAGDAKWLDEFFPLCNGCLERLHAIAIHTYVHNIQQLKEKVSWFRKYKKPIWITEMAGGLINRTVEDQLRFMKDAILFLDNDPAIERYAWFSLEPYAGSEVSALISKKGDTKLTELGNIYNYYHG